jgi:hypothetical protein
MSPPTRPETQKKPKSEWTSLHPDLYDTLLGRKRNENLKEAVQAQRAIDE